MLQDKIRSLRTSLSQSPAPENIEKVVVKAMQHPHSFRVYAALGSEHQGATLDDVARRTGMKASRALVMLRELKALGALEEKNGRFFARARTADALSFKNPESLAHLIAHVCSDLQKRKNDVVRSPTNLTIYSAFSIRKVDQLKCKERIQEALFEVLDEFQHDDGEAVEEVFLSLSSQA